MFPHRTNGGTPTKNYTIMKGVGIMLSLKQLDELKSIDISAVDKNTLADISGMTFDNSLSREERMRRILRLTKNPYCFRYGDMAVKVEFSDGCPPLQDVMTNFLIRQKSGL